MGYLFVTVLSCHFFFSIFQGEKEAWLAVTQYPITRYFINVCTGYIFYKILGISYWVLYKKV